MNGFARFDRELGANAPHAIDALLDAARALVVEVTGSEATCITDALLPGFFWLLGRYSTERIDAFSDDLALVLSPVQPLLVYLDADVATSVGRAGAARGACWPEEMAVAVTRWHVPYYPASPLRNLDDMFQFHTWLNERTLDLLARWPGPTRVLMATRTPVDALVQALLQNIGRAPPEAGAPTRVSDSTRQVYASNPTD